MTPTDSYYKNRRDHGTVITLACNEPAKTCFCSTYGIDASLNTDKNGSKGDVSAWLSDGKYFFEANTEKGKAFVEKAKAVLKDEDAKAVDSLKKDIKDKTEKLPFAHLDLSKFQGKDMLKIFNSKIWDPLLGQLYVQRLYTDGCRKSSSHSERTKPPALYAQTHVLSYGT